MKGERYYDDSFAVGKGWGGSHIELNKEYNYLDGDVITPQGIVLVYAQGDKEAFHASRLDFVWRGRYYVRNFEKRYTPRGLVTKAKQFAKEIVESEGSDEGD